MSAIPFPGCDQRSGGNVARFLFARVEAWVILLLLLFGMLGVIGFGALVVDQIKGKQRFGALGEAALSIAEIPETARQLLKEDTAMMAFNRRRFEGKAGWTPQIGTTAAQMDGYLLLSRYDGDASRHVVELVDLRDLSTAYDWTPDANSLLEGSRQESAITNFTNWTAERFRYIHPLLLEDGSLIVKDHQSPLIKIDKCSKMVWRQDVDLFHHSTELSNDGKFWVPSRIEPSALGVTEEFSDDAVTLVNGAGEIELQQSISQAMIDAGYMHLLFTAGHYHDDPVHLNDIQPVPGDGPYWKAGDLFLSLRHKSLVMLYRPSTREILWLKQGPWMAQHDVDIVDDHTISVFSNNSYDFGKGGYVLESSEVLFYDFETNEVSSPFRTAAREGEVKTLFEGLSELLPTGHVLIEEENSGRIVIYDSDQKLTAEFVNRAADGNIYRLGWSRYIGREVGDSVLGELKKGGCNA